MNIYKHIPNNQFKSQMHTTMNFSRLLPFLPLLMLIPATSDAALVTPSTNHPGLNPSDLCPLVQIVEHELCDTHMRNASKISDLCVLLHNYNASFCSKQAHLMEPLSNDVMSIRILEREFHDNTHERHDIHDLCPIINFIDQELCTSHTRHQTETDFEFYPKQLCPLLNFTYTELCS